MGTPSSLPAYDPKIIEQYADNLYRKASSFVAGSLVIGASLGAAFGAVPLTSLGAAWPIPSYLGFGTLLLGGLLGGLIGYVIGDTRSFNYRLQAQSALCQLQSERNTALLARAVSAHASVPVPRQAEPDRLTASAQPVAPDARPSVPQPPLSPPVSKSHVA